MSQHRMRAKLIFNPIAGAVEAAPTELLDVIHEMQTRKLVPEVFLIEEGCDLPGMVQDALAQGIRLFVVCGGDGTISAVAQILASMPSAHATMGIIPSGTQNNIALSLGIPTDIPAAISILRTGRRIKVDMGMATCEKSSSVDGGIPTPFLEVCSVGLASKLFPSADDVQHGNLVRIGDFLATLVNTPPAEIHLTLDDEQEVRSLGYVLLVSNMPYIGRHYRVGPVDSFRDGLLDVLFFAELSKLELLSYIYNGIGPDMSEDSRIQHYHVRRVLIDSQPDMPIMVDGIALGEGRVQIEVQRHVLTVMVGEPAPEAPADSGEPPEVEANEASG